MKEPRLSELPPEVRKALRELWEMKREMPWLFQGRPPAGHFY